MADLAIGCQDPTYRVVSLTENYCKSPTLPVGYMIHQVLSVSTKATASVRARDFLVLNEHSRILTVLGNEAGVGGGVVSGVNLGMCRPSKAWAEKVCAEGGRVIVHQTVMEMNCCGEHGPHDTLGIILADTSSMPTVAAPSDKFGKNGLLKKEWLDEQLKNGKAKSTKTPTDILDESGNPKTVDVIEVDPPIDVNGKYGGYAIPGEDYVVVQRSSNPLQQGSTTVHEVQHWEDHQQNSNIPSHETEINARNAEIDWRNQQKGKGQYSDSEIDEMNAQDQEEIKAFEQFNKKANEISKGDLTLYGLGVVNGTYCEVSKYKDKPSYAKQCEVMSQYEKELELEKNKKELEEKKATLERLKKTQQKSKQPELFEGPIKSTESSIQQIEAKIKTLTPAM